MSAKRVLGIAVLATTALLQMAGSSIANAQALPTATGPGTYVAIGGSFAEVQSDYGKTLIHGTAIFIDVNPHWRTGVEVEARRSNYPHYGERQSTLLVGPRWSMRSSHFVPYAKFLMGGGQFDFPHGYGTGHYFVVAPGAGLDLSLNRRLKVRLMDLEYQTWPGFSFGALHPYSVGAGISVQIWGTTKLRLSR